MVDLKSENAQELDNSHQKGKWRVWTRSLSLPDDSVESENPPARQTFEDLLSEAIFSKALDSIRGRDHQHRHRASAKNRPHAKLPQASVALQGSGGWPVLTYSITHFNVYNPTDVA